MAMDLGALLLGGVLLYFGAEWLVKGAAGLAGSFGVKPLVIGLTVVAYGTSMPELVVSAAAALEGRGAIAIGNVVGSNIANIGLILGVTALISPPAVDGALIRRELPALLATTALLPLLLLDGVVSRVEAALLLLGALAFTLVTLRTKPSKGVETAATAEADAEAAGAPKSQGRLALAGLGLLGLAFLVGGGKAFVDGAVGLALAVGMSERVVGLTIVAIGTSLPELAASLVAALRGHSSIAIGNVIGSNIFNVLFILGGAGSIRPIEMALSSVALDLVALAIATLMALLFMRSSRVITRLEGGFLAGSYGAFLALLAVT